MSRMLNHLPMLITSLRLIVLPLLWAFALAGMQRALAIGLLFAILTDVLDGQAGRWLGHASEAESRFDSLADKVLTLSVLAWLLLLHPTIISNHPRLSLAVLLLAVASWLTGLLRFGQVTGLHLRSAKIAGVAQGLFVLHTFWNSTYNSLLLYGAAALWCLAAVEEIIVQLTHQQIDGSIRSAFPLRVRRRA